MKKTFLFILLLYSINGKAQLYVKGSAVALPFFDGFVKSFSIAGEFRYKYAGVEYLHNNYDYYADASFKCQTQQLMVKGYFSFTKNNRLKNLYLSTFYRHENKISYEDILYPGVPNPNINNYEGLGLMSGKNYDFYKYFGTELGIYYYNLNVRIYNSATMSLTPVKEPHFGLRLYLYFKTEIFKSKSEQT